MQHIWNAWRWLSGLLMASQKVRLRRIWIDHGTLFKLGRIEKMKCFKVEVWNPNVLEEQVPNLCGMERKRRKSLNVWKRSTNLSMQRYTICGRTLLVDCTRCGTSENPDVALWEVLWTTSKNPGGPSPRVPFRSRLTLSVLFWNRVTKAKVKSEQRSDF